MKKLTAAAILSVSAFALSAGNAFADFTLNILHINDLHSRIESINASDSTCSDEDEEAGECFGGMARVATKINERRDALTGEGANVIVLDAGDQFQGSLFYSTYKGADTVEFMNQIGFDAMAVGNHEFDDGPSVLAEFIDAAEFPVISGNTVVAEAEEVLAGKIEEWTVLDVGGEQVGILSVLATDTDVTSGGGPNVTFDDEIDYLNDAVARMEGEGINKIVLLSHVGFVRDQQIAAAVDGIDVIVGGHSHTRFSNTEDDSQAYPTMVQNPSGADVPIVSAYAYSKYVGELQIVFDDDGNVTSATGDTILLDNSVEPDADILARVAELAGPIEETMAQPVSETTADLDGDRANCRVRECTMGNLIADAILDRTAEQGVRIAIQNGGGIRASIAGGEVTMGDVLTVLPFQNTLATFDLTGADIIASLEAAVSGIEEGAGKFPQVAGIRYTFDPSVAPNEGRIQSVEIEEDGEWVALDESETYGVGTNDFIRRGGDGYSIFAENAENAYDFGPSLELVVAEYLEANRPYEPVLEGRIVNVAEAEPSDPAAEEVIPSDASEEPQPDAAAPAAEAPAAPEEPAEAPAPTEAPATGDQDVVSEPVEPVEEPATEAPAAPMPPETPAASEAPAVSEDAADPVAAPEGTASEPASPAQGGGEHAVVAGDTLWDIAAEYLGDGARWPEIAQANPAINPHRLDVGATLTIPSR